MSTLQPNTAQIRKKLDRAFDDSGLSAFCFDYFPEVYERFSLGMGKDNKNQLLLDYCRRHPTGFEMLLNNLHTEDKISDLQKQELKPLIDVLSVYILGTTKDRSDHTHGSGLTHTSQRMTTWLPVVALLVVGLIVGGFFGYMISGSGEEADSESAAILATAEPATEEAAATEVAVAPTVTRIPTNTPIPPTNTPIPPTDTPIPALAPSATRVAQDGMVQVYVPEGEFLMGASKDDEEAELDEFPQHTVYLDAYWIDQTEVTNEMFGRFVEQTSYQTEAEKEGSAYVCAGGSCDETDGADWQHPQGPESTLNGLETHPVVQVSWNDASAYCEWADKRLPTEAEWEKAARGTDGRKYPWGEQAPTGELANFCDGNCSLGWKDESVDDGYADTSPVGSYLAGASPYGALDMAGNVWEWVNDFYDENYYAESPRINPRGPSVEAPRVLRGASWTNVARSLRAPNRAKYVDRADDLGFRCAASDS